MNRRRQAKLPLFADSVTHGCQRHAFNSIKKVVRQRHKVIVALILCGAFLSNTRVFTVTASFAAPFAQSHSVTKQILYYNKYWFNKDFQFGKGKQPFLEYDCPVYNCNVTSRADLPNNPSLHATYDAFLVSVQQPDGFDIQELRHSIEAWRKPHHRFIFMIMEAPYYEIMHFDQLNGFFNWTMTYKWDSDLPRPYGWFERKPSASFDYLPVPSPRPYAESPPETWIPFRIDGVRKRMQEDPAFAALAKRPKKVAWIVSKCQTRSLREEYVQDLRQHIPVEIFGGHCGDGPKCDRRYSISELDSCTKQVQQDFKFYLAFENSFCNDYATEKFFRRMESSVVITLGQANYSHLAPPHSHINTFDFDSAKELAEYLLELDLDDEQYLSYFWWQEYYQTMCRLCDKLHNPSEPSSVYDDLSYWWRGSAECDRDTVKLRSRLNKQQSNIRSHTHSDLWLSHVRNAGQN
eukprot:Nitzschia sp. Nitz4//scaffold13_size275219//33021//34454//NITZ4_000842-RA/size275219-snap-gene-0.33-mRNA-1//-1//CDS//3329535918//1515//frame0